MRRHRSIAIAFALAAAAVATAGPAAMAQSQPTCSSSFRVLHDDHIGALSVAAGSYRLRPTGLTCAQASTQFAQFLTDYDGVLPKPWRYDGENTFVRGTDGTAFTFVRQSRAAAAGPVRTGGGSHGELVCPGTFRVMHDDRIGALSFPSGDYRVTLLGATLSCDGAEARFARFLKRTDGRLGGGWVLLPDGGEFVRGSIRDGFRVKPLDSDGQSA